MHEPNKSVPSPTSILRVLAVPFVAIMLIAVAEGSAHSESSLYLGVSGSVSIPATNIIETNFGFSEFSMHSGPALGLRFGLDRGFIGLEIGGTYAVHDFDFLKSQIDGSKFNLVGSQSLLEFSTDLVFRPFREYRVQPIVNAGIGTAKITWNNVAFEELPVSIDYSAWSLSTNLGGGLEILIPPKFSMRFMYEYLVIQPIELTTETGAEAHLTDMKYHSIGISLVRSFQL